MPAVVGWILQRAPGVEAWTGKILKHRTGWRGERMGIENFSLDKDEAVLVIIDIQERLAAVMGMREQVVRNTTHLIELAKMLKIPIIATEQYPKGLGRTLPELQTVLPEYTPVEKTAFNCCGEPSFIMEIKKYRKKKAIITGMETHICVLQTCVGLIKEGFVPHIVGDAVCSRTKQNWKAGLRFMRDSGAVVTGTETVLFQLLGVAGTDEFKAVSRMIK